MNITLIMGFILTLIALSVILAILMSKRAKPRVYKPKGQYLLSPGEKRFFDALSQSIPPNLYICPKVRIADLVETTVLPTDPNYWKTVAPMNQKHVDFVLVNRSDFAPQVAIELDGGSHKDQARERRDAFVSSVFQSAGIPLLHVPVQSFYHYQMLREQITAALNKRG